MQVIVDALGEGPADALHPGQVTDPGLQDPLQPAELAQERATALWSQAGDGLQAGTPPEPRTALPVSGYRKAVCLIAYLLDQVQRG